MAGSIIFPGGIGNLPGFAGRPGSWQDASAVGAIRHERNRSAALVALLGTDPRVQRVIAAIRAGERPEAVAAELNAKGGKPK